MSEDVLDGVAEAAVLELADALSASLSDAVDGAATRALERIEQELENRLGQIDGATARVVDLFGTIGDEIRTRAAGALADGIRAEVLPLLAQSGHQAAVRHAQQISDSFAGVEKAVRDLVAESSANLTATTERHAKDARAHLDKVVPAGVELGTKRVLQRSEALEQAILKAIADATRIAREDTRKAAEAVSTAAAARAAEIKHDTAAVSAQIDRSHNEVNAHLARVAHDLRVQNDEAAANLRGVAALQERRVRQMFYGQLAIGAIVLTILILLVAHVG